MFGKVPARMLLMFRAVVLMATAGAQWAYAQVQPATFSFQHLGKEAGLSNDKANYFLSEDSRGFIWIGSLNGFYRYDGLRLRHFLIPTNEEDTFTPDQIIQSKFWEDGMGNLWFSTYNSLHCLRRADGSIRNFRAPDSADRSYHVFHLEKNTGRIWLRAGEQVWTFLPKSGRWAVQFATSGIRFEVSADKKGAPQYIIACAWLKSPVSVHRKTGSNTWLSENYLSPEMEVRSALPCTDSTVWLLARQGLLEFNFRNGETLRHWTQTPKGEPLNAMGGAYLEAENCLLVCTKSEGLLVLANGSSEWRDQLLPMPEQSNALSSAAPRGVLISSSGQVWIGHETGGVDYSRILPTGFEELMTENPTQIRAAVQTPDGALWMAAADGRLFRHFGNKTAPMPAPPRPLVQLTCDESGTIWGLSQQGLYRMKKGAAGWEICYEAASGLVSVNAGIGGRVLLTTQDGIFDLREQAGKFSWQPAQELASYRGYYFSELYSVGRQTVLIPFESKELWMATIEKQTLRMTKRMDIGGDTHGGCFTPAGDSLWIASNTGLLLYTGGRLSRVLESAADLAGADVLGVFRTADGYLWLNTSQGLYRYLPANKALNAFFERDGLPGDQFSHLAGLMTSGGRICIGHNKGMMVFDPTALRMQTPKPTAHIEALWINNAPYETPQLIDETEKLALGYRENTLSLELLAVSFHEAAANTLQYRLRGYDDNWATAPNGGFARFTKLPPGRYHLEIRPRNANGEFGNLRSMQIDIRPPFWQTTWFRVAGVVFVLLLVGGSTGAYYRRKLRKQKEMLERQQALHAERNRIAKELHDDMGGSLSSIRFLSEDLLLDGVQQAMPEIQRISHLAEKALENMREIIWAMDSDKNTLQDLALKLRSLAMDLLSDNKITAELDISISGHEAMVLGGERRRNIYLIAKEALHNIVKHAGADKVRITLRLQSGRLMLEIADNGGGLPAGARQSGGYGLSSMEARAKAIGGVLEWISQPDEGVIVRLSTVP